LLLWRISEHMTLDGIGGLVVSGRWHNVGRAIVYTAESSALALLEALVRMQCAKLPAPYQLLRIEVPDGIVVEHFPAPAGPPRIDESMTWGDRWLGSGKTALASVPAAVAPLSRNILINPVHPDAAAIRVAEHSRWPWDKRLFKPAP
jgi:RES domain-containing protein